MRLSVCRMRRTWSPGNPGCGGKSYPAASVPPSETGDAVPRIIDPLGIAKYLVYDEDCFIIQPGGHVLLLLDRYARRNNISGYS